LKRSSGSAALRKLPHIEERLFPQLFLAGTFGLDFCIVSAIPNRIRGFDRPVCSTITYPVLSHQLLGRLAPSTTWGFIPSFLAASKISESLGESSDSDFFSLRPSLLVLEELILAGQTTALPGCFKIQAKPMPLVVVESRSQLHLVQVWR